MKSIDGGNLISFEVAKYNPDKCNHNQTVIDEELAMVKCKTCGKELNPIWVLMRFAREDSRYRRNMKANAESEKAYEKRIRTKCQHCGKMTRIRGL